MSDGINATPAARELAETSGIDLATVTATGATGIVVGDVERAIAAAAAAGGLAPGALRAGAVDGDAYTFGAPVAGGSRVTVRAGEPVPAALLQYVPEADRLAHFDAAE